VYCFFLFLSLNLSFVISQACFFFVLPFIFSLSPFFFHLFAVLHCFTFLSHVAASAPPKGRRAFCRSLTNSSPIPGVWLLGWTLYGSLATSASGPRRKAARSARNAATGKASGPQVESIKSSVGYVLVGACRVYITLKFGRSRCMVKIVIWACATLHYTAADKGGIE
jgi:hypothetical protein